MQRTLAAAVGGLAVAAAYAAARRAGLTERDLAKSVAPDNALIGRLGQLGAGVLACMPASRVPGVTAGGITGALAGIPVASKAPDNRSAVVDLVAHAIGGLVTAFLVRFTLKGRRGSADTQADG